MQKARTSEQRAITASLEFEQEAIKRIKATAEIVNELHKIVNRRIRAGVPSGEEEHQEDESNKYEEDITFFGRGDKLGKGR